MANNSGDSKKRLKVFLFEIYIFIILWLTLTDREWGERRYMLVPFWEYVNVFKGIDRGYYIKQILGNLVMLMPLEIMLPIVKNVKLKHVFIIALCFSAGIEITQFITDRGLMEFDDVFNNTVGAVVGFGIYRLITLKIQELKCK